MESESDRRRHRSIRLKGYDYRQAGAYFITLVAHHREFIFGRVVDAKVEFSLYGDVVHECWESIPMHFPDVVVDGFVIMPNHLHGVLIVGARHAVPLHAPERFGQPVAGSIPTIIRSFKAAATREINRLRGCLTPVWQRNYFEHVVRNEESLQRIRQYIVDNPARWEFDRENPAATKPEPELTWLV